MHRVTREPLVPHTRPEVHTHQEVHIRQEVHITQALHTPQVLHCPLVLCTLVPHCPLVLCTIVLGVVHALLNGAIGSTRALLDDTVADTLVRLNDTVAHTLARLKGADEDTRALLNGTVADTRALLNGVVGPEIATLNMNETVRTVDEVCSTASLAVIVVARGDIARGHAQPATDTAGIPGLLPVWGYTGTLEAGLALLLVTALVPTRRAAKKGTAFIVILALARHTNETTAAVIARRMSVIVVVSAPDRHLKNVTALARRTGVIILGATPDQRMSIVPAPCLLLTRTAIANLLRFICRPLEDLVIALRLELGRTGATVTCLQGRVPNLRMQFPSSSSLLQERAQGRYIISQKGHPHLIGRPRGFSIREVVGLHPPRTRNMILGEGLVLKLQHTLQYPRPSPGLQRRPRLSFALHRVEHHDQAPTYRRLPLGGQRGLVPQPRQLYRLSRTDLVLRMRCWKMRNTNPSSRAGKDRQVSSLLRCYLS